MIVKKMKKVCELCKSPAKIYCESDEASLCWDCDFKVHSANFLVAKHLRNLLCHVCQSPTAWNASGEKLGRRTISVCERCVLRRREERQAGNENEIDDEEEGEGAGDNQLVLSSETSLPPAASSSSSEESSSRFRNGDRDICLKRFRQNSLDLCSEDDLDCTSSNKNISTPSSACAAAAARCAKTAFVDSLPHIPLKFQRTESNQSPRVYQRLAGSKSEAVVLPRKRFDRSSGEGRNNRRADECDSSVSS